MSRTEVHFSELSAANGCKLRWQLQYKERLQPLVMEERITVGTLVHKVMQDYLKATFKPAPGQDKQSMLQEYLERITESGKTVPGVERDDWSVAVKRFAYEIASRKIAEMKDAGQVMDLSELAEDPEQAALFEESSADERAVIQRAADVSSRLIDYFDERYEVVEIDGKPAVEFELRLPIRRKGRKTLDYVGTLDVLCRSKSTGFILLGDYKVRSSLTNLTGDLLHSQTALYQYALDKRHGIATHGSVIFQAHNAEPREPAITQKNVPSKANVITTLEIYQAAMVRCGLDPWDPEYEGILQKIQERRWVDDHVIPRKSSGEEIQRSFTEVLLPGLRDLEAMDKMKGDRGILIGYQCKNCGFFPLCEAQLAGYDREYIKETQFKVRPE